MDEEPESAGIIDTEGGRGRGDRTFKTFHDGAWQKWQKNALFVHPISLAKILYRSLKVLLGKYYKGRNLSTNCRMFATVMHLLAISAATVSNSEISEWLIWHRWKFPNPLFDPTTR